MSVSDRNMSESERALRKAIADAEAGNNPSPEILKKRRLARVRRIPVMTEETAPVADEVSAEDATVTDEVTVVGEVSVDDTFATKEAASADEATDDTSATEEVYTIKETPVDDANATEGVPAAKEASVEDTDAPAEALSANEVSDGDTGTTEEVPTAEEVSDGDSDLSELEVLEEVEDTDDVRPSAARYYLRVAGVLLLICTVIAGLLATVNSITKDKIAQNELAVVNTAISEIFGEYDSYTSYGEQYDAPVTDVYAVIRDSATVGYAVFVTESGYKEGLKLIVAVSDEHKVIGVRITESSETPGLGSKAENPDYLDGYIGLDSSMKFNEDIDAIAGATRTSSTVYRGVLAALHVFDQTEEAETDEQ